MTERRREETKGPGDGNAKGAQTHGEQRDEGRAGEREVRSRVREDSHCRSRRRVRS